MLLLLCLYFHHFISALGACAACISAGRRLCTLLYDIIRKILVCIWSLFHARIYYCCCPCPMHFFALLGLTQCFARPKTRLLLSPAIRSQFCINFFPLWKKKASSCFLKMNTTVAAMIMMMGQLLLLLFWGGLVSLLKSLQYIVYVMFLLQPKAFANFFLILSFFFALFFFVVYSLQVHMTGRSWCNQITI